MQRFAVTRGALGLLLLALLAGCQGATNNPVAAASTPATAPVAGAHSSPTPISAISSMSVIHTVQPGENLYRIALRYGVSASKLAEINGITDPALITAGQHLTIPLGTRPDPATATPTPTITPLPPTPTSTPDPLAATSTPAPPGDAPTPIGPPTIPPTPAATPIPPDNVNGVAISTFVVMPPAVQDNMRKIFAAGQALGRNAHAFSKLGDSTIENPHFLARFDSEPYNLANYIYLQSVIDYYRGSFGRQGVAVRRGLHSWSAMNPTWADETQCLPDEGPVACEIRLNNPSLLLIRLGSNDAGVPETFRQSMQAVIDYCLQNGVIPILGTKADRFEGPDNINNNILRELAAKNAVPLWDFDLVAPTMPNAGIDPADGTHMTFFFAHDYTLPEAWTRGHAVHNLTALIMLDEVWKVLGLNSAR